MLEFDLAVIGSGPGGYRAAVLAALRGLTVAIIEKQDWGGCCLNRGCVPKKAWHHTAKLIAANKTMSQRGIVGELQVDMHKAWEHQEEVVETVQSSYVEYMKHLKIKSFEGHASFVDATHIQIDTNSGEKTNILAKHTIIATGSIPHIPRPFEEIPGKVITSDTLFDLPPPQGQHVTVIGSGVIATEFAFIFAMMGKQLSWMSRSPMLRKLPFSPQANSTLKKSLDKHQIYLQTNTHFKQVELEGEKVVLTINDGEKLNTDWICLATGRQPNSSNLNLEKLNIQTDAKGFIQCNQYLQTTLPNIYAIGDVANEEMTANHALADATIAVENIINSNSKTQNNLWVPTVIYSATELARIGMDEDMAEDEELEPAVGFAAFETSPRALGQDDTEGFVRLIGDMDDGKLLGGEIVGAEAGELIHSLSLAPNQDTALNWIAKGVYNHPSRLEEILNATETLANKWGLKDSIFKH